MIEADAPLFIFETLDSTNEEARRRVNAGDMSPVYLLARRQTAGRGRRGRGWKSVPGNLFLTYLGVARRPPGEIALLGFAAGLALKDFCDELVPGRARLKWPNDLFLDGRKAAGVLLESGAIDEKTNWFCIGIGFNLAGAPDDAGQPTAALCDLIAGPVPEPEVVARDLAAKLAAWAGRYEREGFAPLCAAWEQAAYGLGTRVRTELGGSVVEGIARGLDAAGAFLIETDAGQVRAVSAGDIHFPPAAD